MKLKTSVSFNPFWLCKLLIRCLVKVVFPTPISPIKNIQSPFFNFLLANFKFIIDLTNAFVVFDILSLNMNYIQKRHLQGIMFFEQMAKYAPAFGLLGTTIGLVQLLANLKDPSLIGQGMSIALVSTFYGILMANFLFAPISGRLRAYSIEELFQKEMLKVGILSVAKNESSVIVQEKMMLFLTQKERKNDQ